jgi:hypothetical protein
MKITKSQLKKLVKEELTMKITKSQLKQIIKEELKSVLDEFGIAGEKYVISIDDQKLVGTFDYSRVEESRFLPNQAGTARGLSAGRLIPNGTKMVDDAPPMR